MRKKIIPILTLFILFALTGCNSAGNVDDVQISDWETSEIYSDGDIEAAHQAVMAYFTQNFRGYTLTNLCYPGDSYAEEFNEMAEKYGGDEAIVILSSFDTGPSGGDGSLNSNSTYDNWKWILIRNDGGSWQHADHGY